MAINRDAIKQETQDDIDVEMTLEDKIFVLVSGFIGTEDQPAAYGMLSQVLMTLDKNMPEEEQLHIDTEKEIQLSSAIYTVYYSGGAVVLTADFNPDYHLLFQEAVDACEEYLQHKGEDETDIQTKQMELTLAPVMLKGKASLVFRDLVFASGTELSNHKLRLTLVYNNLETKLYQTDVDMDQINNLIEMELEQTDRIYDEELANLQEQIEEAERDTYFDDALRDSLGNIMEETQNEEE
jgi:hypothetical protein